MLITTLAALAAAYILGSLAFAVLVSRAMGLPDPRSFGSGNPGATNVLRSGRKSAAVLTLLLDAAKGWLPVTLAAAAANRQLLPPDAVALVALAVFLGHLYPVFFGFKGGKGVATAAGIVLAFSPWLGLASILTWLIVAFFFRYSSLAALAATAFAPFYFWLGSAVLWPADPSRLLALLAISLLIVWRHRGNIAKLLAGQESRIGQKKG